MDCHDSLNFVIDNMVAANIQQLKKKKLSASRISVIHNKMSLQMSPTYDCSVLLLETVACLRIP